MTKHVIKTSPHKFFLLNKRQLLMIAGIGALFGVMTLVLTGWLSFGAMLVNFRVGLIVAAVLSLMALLKQQVESALLIVVMTLIVLWNQWLQFEHFWQAALFYGLLSSAVMTLFGWIAQLNNWRLRLGVGLLVTVLLSLI